MLYKRRGLPEVEEVVLCKVTKIFPNSVFVDLLEFQDSGMVIKSDLKKGLPESHFEHQNFDLIFLDPPYKKNFIPPLLDKISKSNILFLYSCVVAELSKNEILPNTIAKLKIVDTRLYGDTRINIYEVTS